MSDSLEEIPPEDEGRWPCRVVKTDTGAKVVEPCWAMEECLDEPYGRGTKRQGLSTVYLVDMKERKHTRTPIVFKGGKHTKGVQINFCPFCGASTATMAEVPS